MASHGHLDHRDSPHDALIKALERVDEMDEVLIVWVGKDGCKTGGVDSDIEIRDALYLVKLYEHWIMAATLGFLDREDEG